MNFFNVLIVFFLGGYLVPAVYFGVHAYLHYRGLDDGATVAESVASGILNGLTWPFTPHRFEDEG